MIKMKLQYVVMYDSNWNNWLASCVEYDIMTQGNTKKEAIESLERTVIGQIHLDVTRGLNPLQDIDPPPLSVSEMTIQYEHPLSPCPFCGKDVDFIERGDSKDSDSYDIGCNSDDCYLEGGADWWLSKEEVITMWNTRNSK